MLKRVGERQLPCDFQVTWKVLSCRKLLTHSRRGAGRLALASLWMMPSWEALSKAF